MNLTSPVQLLSLMAHESTLFWTITIIAHCLLDTEFVSH